MKTLWYIILGILQGITEPLPISSSGHIYIFKSLFKLDVLNDLNFEIFVNFASFVAIFIIFRKDIFNFLKGFFGFITSKGKKYKNEFKYCMLIVVGTIPTGIIGLLVKEPLEKVLSENTFLVGICFVFTAIMLLLVTKSKGTKNDYDITYLDALLIGVLQAVALAPGISRSGMVLVGCLLCKLCSEASLKYTFMLYMPVSVVSMVMGVHDLASNGMDKSMLFNYLIGMIFAFIFTYISYKWLSNIVKKGGLWKFSIYLVLAGGFTIFYFI